ncbi:MAG: PAS domain S-box protein [Coleofasciculaceae cyanobacterium]
MRQKKTKRRSLKSQKKPAKNNCSPQQLLNIWEETRKHKQALLQSEVQFRAIFDDTCQFMALLKPDGTLLEVNSKILELGGQKSDEIINQPFWQANWWNSDTKQLKKAIATCAQGELVAYEVTIIDANQVLKVIDLSLKPIQDKAGNIVLLLFEGRDLSEGKQAKALMKGQNQLLEMIAKGEKLVNILSKLALLIEKQCPQMQCSFLLLDKNGTKLHFCAAPSLPDAYNQAIDGMTIGPYTASCGTAAYWREPVVVSDIATHPLWLDWRELALSHQLAACWSVPIFSTVGKVLGTFALYYSEPHTPNRYEQEITAKATQLARIAIERYLAQEDLFRSNAMLKAQQEAAIDGILVLDENHRVTSYNQRFCELWNIPKSLIQTSDEQRVLKWLQYQLQYPQEFCEKIQHLYAHPTETSYDEFIFRDGRIFEFYSAPVLSPNGSYYGRIWYNRDITERKRSEAVLRETEEKYRTLIELAGDAIIVVDAQTEIILDANRMAEKMLGYARSEIVGLHQTEVQPQEKLEQYSEIFKQYVESCGVFKTELELRHKDGSLVPMEVSATVVDVQDKRIVQGIFRDISDRKQTEKALKQAKDAAVIANRAKTEFLANMSHELRTPLNGVLGYAQILKKETSLGAKQQEQVGIIQQCGEHLLTLLNDILDLSKIEARKMELYLSDFQLPYFLQSIIEMVRIRAEQKSIAFRYQLLSPLPNTVKGDEKRLRQVLINLLGNAVKFTDIGGVTFQVGYLNSEQIGEHQEQITVGSTLSPIPSPKMRFIVEDTGIGMAQEQLADIFLPFHQIGDYQRRSEGTGLGLAISQKLAQLMGSEIKVGSTLGQGSVFWLDLDLPAVTENIEVTKFDPGHIISLKEKTYKVLVVDDRWENRSVLVDLLSPLGFEIVQATDGQDCINQAIQTQPDLILLDMVMPGMDGFEAARKLRQISNLQNIVIIATSASAFDYDQEKSLAAGCNGFISKPVQIEQLLEQLRRYLGLEWVYQTNPSLISSSPTTLQGEHSSAVSSQHKNEIQVLPVGITPNSSETTIVIAPPTEAITTLYELAMIGDIKGIQEQAKKIEELDQQFVPFAQQLEQLAKGFQEKQILGFVRKYMAGNQ